MILLLRGASVKSRLSGVWRLVIGNSVESRGYIQGNNGSVTGFSNEVQGCWGISARTGKQRVSNAGTRQPVDSRGGLAPACVTALGVH